MYTFHYTQERVHQLWNVLIENYMPVMSVKYRYKSDKKIQAANVDTTKSYSVS